MTLLNMTFDQCGQACVSTPGCQIFTQAYTKDKTAEKDQCFLRSNKTTKATTNSMSRNSGSLNYINAASSGLRSQPPPPTPPRTFTWPMLERILLDGRNVGNAGSSALTVQDCQQRCVNEPLCIGIAYAASSGACWMKGSITGCISDKAYTSYAINDAFFPAQSICLAYYKPPPPPKPPSEHCTFEHEAHG
jgi:hypothetical protein